MHWGFVLSAIAALTLLLVFGSWVTIIGTLTLVVMVLCIAQ